MVVIIMRKETGLVWMDTMMRTMNGWRMRVIMMKMGFIGNMQKYVEIYHLWFDYLLLFIVNILINISIVIVRINKKKYFFIFYAFAIAYKLFKHQEVLKKNTLPSRLLSNVISFIFSIISGIVGIGGATLFVPFLIKNNIPPKLAIGTSSVLGFFIGLSASIAIYVGYLYSGLNDQLTFGFIYTPAILFLTLPSLIFIKLSAGWLLKLDDLLIKRLFGLLLIIIGIMMLLN